MPGAMLSTIKESDLFAPLEEYFLKKNFQVRAEVKTCDLVAISGDDIVIVELKKQFNLKVVYQALRRLKITPLVYVAIAEPKNRSPKTNWPQIKLLLRRLQLGFITVDLKNSTDPALAKVEVIFEPKAFNNKIAAKARQSILKEFWGRSGNFQKGGSKSQPLQSAYRENVIKIAALLYRHKKLNLKQLKALGSGDKTALILRYNYDNYFKTIEKIISVTKPQTTKKINSGKGLKTTQQTTSKKKVEKYYSFNAQKRAEIERKFPQLYKIYFETNNDISVERP